MHTEGSMVGRGRGAEAAALHRSEDDERGPANRLRVAEPLGERAADDEAEQRDGGLLRGAAAASVLVCGNGLLGHTWCESASTRCL